MLSCSASLFLKIVCTGLGGSTGLTDADELPFRHARLTLILVHNSSLGMPLVVLLKQKLVLVGDSEKLLTGTFIGPEGEATLRATGDFETVEAILDTIVRESADGTHLRLADLATVETGLEKRTNLVRYNGSPALMLSATVCASTGGLVRISSPFFQASYM